MLRGMKGVCRMLIVSSVWNPDRKYLKIRSFISIHHELHKLCWAFFGSKYKLWQITFIPIDFSWHNVEYWMANVAVAIEMIKKHLNLIWIKGKLFTTINRCFICDMYVSLIQQLYMLIKFLNGFTPLFSVKVLICLIKTHSVLTNA